MESKVKKFLFKSRASTYASGKKPEIINGLKIYIIEDGDLEYRDSYYDQKLVFQGQEVVLKNGKPVWSMNYRGSAIEGTDTGKVFGFLQNILKEHSDQVRLPGDREYIDFKWKYEDHCDGKIEEFNGFEEIYNYPSNFRGKAHLNKKLVHWMKYFGGEIK